MKLSYEDVKRYIAHINLKKIGSFGQKKIIDTKVLIIGVGGLGSPVALYLASSGINNIGIVDHDKIDISIYTDKFYLMKKTLINLKLILLKKD